ncbi:histidine--tRNA ligase [Candidatus Woesearchaeota archaeon]|nr:histidine--tRNA ligase [Candidatus Woesearchaeota archaeon]
MKLTNAKGTRDFPPEQAIARQKLVDTLKKVFELYGFNPLETPVLEPYEVLSAKYAGGAEILKETFRLTDQGKRELGLRYDLTVPMCRYLAMNPNMRMPFKRYQAGEVFRDGPIKLARYRQFTQCDVDIVGVKGMAADAEIISVVQTVFEKLGMDAAIKANSRKVMNGMLEAAGVAKEKSEAAILSIDKLEKLGPEAVKKEMKDNRISENSIKAITEIISIKGSNAAKLAKLKEDLKGSKEGMEGLAEIEALLSMLISAANVEFDASLARGLSYYTGTVFEVFLSDSEIKSAVAAGGRYDNMIGSFLGSKKEYPAVGIAFGLDVILDALKKQQTGGRAAAKTAATAYVIPIKAPKEAARVAQQLRKAGINTAVEMLDRGISKSLDYANSQGIPYAVFVGEQELKQGKVKLRDMRTGKEELLSVEESAQIISKNI